MFKYKPANVPKTGLLCAVPPENTLFSLDNFKCEEFQVVRCQGRYLAMAIEKEHPRGHIIFWLDSRKVVASFRNPGAFLILLPDKVLCSWESALHGVSFAGKELWCNKFNYLERPARTSVPPDYTTMMTWDDISGDFAVIDTSDGFLLDMGHDENLRKCTRIQWNPNGKYATTPIFNNCEKPIHVYTSKEESHCSMRIAPVGSNAKSYHIMEIVLADSLVSKTDSFPIESGKCEKPFYYIKNVQFLPGSDNCGAILFSNDMLVLGVSIDMKQREKRLLLMFARTHDEKSRIYDLPLDLFKIILKYAHLIK